MSSAGAGWQLRVVPDFYHQSLEEVGEGRSWHLANPCVEDTICFSQKREALVCPVGSTVSTSREFQQLPQFPCFSEPLDQLAL